MAAAETARLLALLQVKDEMTPGLKKAEGEVTNLERTTNRAGTTVTGLGTKFGGVGRAAAGMGGALNHAKGAIGGLLTGPLGLIGLTAGVGGLAVLFTQSLDKAEEFGVGIQKVKAVVGGSTDTVSGLVDTFDKFGISADKQVSIFGRFEKNIGSLTSTTKKATEFQKAYGFSLTDSGGKALDANTAFAKVADFYNSNASASEKATVLNKLFGKSWVDLIPLLKLGGEGFRKEEADALHLTDTQLANFAKFKTAQRNFADALGDVQTSIGVELLPTLTGGLTTLGSWLDSHRGEIVSFFKGAAAAAGDVARQVGDVFGALKKGWESIPPEFRDLIVKGVVAERTFKFLFGFSPAKLVIDVGETVVSRIAGGFIASLFRAPLPVIVTNQVPGGVPGGPGGGPNLLGLLLAGGAGFLTGSFIGHQLVDPGLNAQQAKIAADMKRQLESGDIGAIQTGLAAIKTGIRDFEALPGAAEEFKGQLDFLKKAQADYVAKLKELTGTATTHPGDPKLKAAEAAAHAADSKRRTQGLADLTDKDLKRATKEGVTEGNRDLPHRRDMNTLGTNIGLALRQAKADITRIESAGLRDVRLGVSVLQGAVVAVLGGGFSNVVQAIHGIQLPAFLDTGPNAPPGGKRRPIKTTDTPAGPPSRDDPSRRNHISLTVHTDITHRDVKKSATIHARYGQTASEAGAQ